MRLNRVPNISLPSDAEMKKKGRGVFEERSAQMHGTKVRAVKYFDKRLVMFLTTDLNCLLGVKCRQLI